MNRDPVELNREFAYCYRCYRQPIEQNNSFIVLICCHIYCETCQNLCIGNQAPDLMFCFICRKPAKYEQLNEFQNKLAKGINSSKKVVDEQKPITKQNDTKSDQIKAEILGIEGKSSGCMTRKRYIELIRMAGGKSNQMTCNKTVGRELQAQLSSLPVQHITSSFQSASHLYRQSQDYPPDLS